MASTTPLWQRPEEVAVIIPFLALTYWAYGELYTKSKKRRSKKARRAIKAVAKKSSTRDRLRRATTVRMGMFPDDHGVMKLKAEDWVGEQRKLKSLQKKGKK